MDPGPRSADSRRSNYRRLDRDCRGITAYYEEETLLPCTGSTELGRLWAPYARGLAIASLLCLAVTFAFRVYRSHLEAPPAGLATLRAAEEREPLPLATYCGDGTLGVAASALPWEPLTVRVGVDVPTSRGSLRFVSWRAPGDNASGAGRVELGITGAGNFVYSEFANGEWSNVTAFPGLQLKGSWHALSVVRDEFGAVQLFADGREVGRGFVPARLPEGVAGQPTELVEADPAAFASSPLVELRIYSEALAPHVLGNLVRPCQAADTAQVHTRGRPIRVGDQVRAAEDLDYGPQGGAVPRGTNGTVMSSGPTVLVLWEGHEGLHKAVVRSDQIIPVADWRDEDPLAAPAPLGGTSWDMKPDVAEELQLGDGDRQGGTERPPYCSNGGHSGGVPSEAVAFPDAPLPKPPLTVTAFVQTARQGFEQVIVAWRSKNLQGQASVDLRLSAGGNLVYGEFADEWHTVEAAPPVALADNGSHAVAVVRDAMGYVSLYADGALVGQGMFPRNLPDGLSSDASASFRPAGVQESVARHLGHDSLPSELDPWHAFEGPVRGVRIFDIQLSASDLSALPLECPGGTTTPAPLALAPRPEPPPMPAILN